MCLNLDLFHATFGVPRVISATRQFLAKGECDLDKPVDKQASYAMWLLPRISYILISILCLGVNVALRHSFTSL